MKAPSSLTLTQALALAAATAGTVGAAWAFSVVAWPRPEQPSAKAADPPTIISKWDTDLSEHCRVARDLAGRRWIGPWTELGEPGGKLGPYITDAQMPARVSCPVSSEHGDGDVEIRVLCLAPPDHSCIEVLGMTLDGRHYPET